MTDDAFLAEVSSRAGHLAAITLDLVAAASPNPPGDTGAAAGIAADLVRAHVPGVEITFHPGSDTIVNLVARIRGARPGRRLIFNGHLDTYPVGTGWTKNPAGEARDGRLYGRGTADMKGGIAASIIALATLAAHRDQWAGEVVLTLAGDEESMGQLGTAHLIATVPHAVGDAVIVGDAGSARVIRFGEKGFVWLEIDAVGRASHGAHVHLGINALDRLRAALDALSPLRTLPVSAPPEVAAAIAAAATPCGAGETAVLSNVTLNIGRIEGGTSLNLVPSAAQAAADLRLPVGISAAAVEAALRAALSPLDGITWRILRRMEPTFTSPAHDIITCVAAAATKILGSAPAINMRVGASDARLYRQAGMPAVVYGPTPHSMGGPDEYVETAELLQVAQVHAAAALAFLAIDREDRNSVLF